MKWSYKFFHSRNVNLFYVAILYPYRQIFYYGLFRGKYPACANPLVFPFLPSHFNKPAIL
jgi:hypothetical protein